MFCKTIFTKYIIIIIIIIIIFIIIIIINITDIQKKYKNS